MDMDNMGMEEKKGKMNKKMVTGLATGIGAVIIIVIIIVLIMNGSPFGLSQKNAAAKAESFVNTDLLSGQGGATVKVVGSTGNLYKLQIAYQGRNIDSYMTKDGKLFFPQVFEMSTSTATAGAVKGDTDQQSPVAEAPKSDKPAVELFVMSYCPYGTQIEKGIIPVVQALGNKIDFKLKFVSYTMHGDKENQENLRQYCIDKTQNAKLLGYLTCFLKASDATGCLKSTGVDSAKVQSCMDSTAKANQVTGTDFSVQKADNEKYGVQGSPTLVINGATVQSGRDSATLLKTICSAFKNAPSECSKQLSSAAPAAGFGEGTASGSTAAAGCATPTN
ncbi:MAG: hypothetical protein WCT26_03275 [Candidatus Buchananbacteria bacterium]|jgi:hypothetical protein